MRRKSLHQVEHPSEQRALSRPALSCSPELVGLLLTDEADGPPVVSLLQARHQTEAPGVRRSQPCCGLSVLGCRRAGAWLQGPVGTLVARVAPKEVCLVSPPLPLCSLLSPRSVSVCVWVRPSAVGPQKAAGGGGGVGWWRWGWGWWRWRGLGGLAPSAV